LGRKKKKEEKRPETRGTTAFRNFGGHVRRARGITLIKKDHGQGWRKKKDRPTSAGFRKLDPQGGSMKPTGFLFEKPSRNSHQKEGAKERTHQKWEGGVNAETSAVHGKSLFARPHVQIKTPFGGYSVRRGEKWVL